MEITESLKLEPLECPSNELINLTDVSVKYNDQIVNKPISFKVEQGDRIVLDGKNGSGKSSILKLILGKPIQYTGSMNLSSGPHYFLCPTRYFSFERKIIGLY